MGFDCTLHAVDERKISHTLVPALVSGKAPKVFTGEDRVLREQTMRSLAKDPSKDAASIVCQLALIFASQSHPYHYERGFALSLWPRQPDGLDVTIPDPNARSRPYTEAEEMLLGTMSDQELADKLGRTMFAIQARRIMFGIAKFNAQRRSWTDEEKALLGKLPDEEVAQRLNRTLESVKVCRGKLHIPKFDSRH